MVDEMIEIADMNDQSVNRCGAEWSAMSATKGRQRYRICLKKKE